LNVEAQETHVLMIFKFIGTPSVLWFACDLSVRLVCDRYFLILVLVYELK